MNIDEMREGLAYVAAELAAIHEGASDGALDDDAQARWDAGQAYITETRAAVEAHEARERTMDELRSIAAAPGRATVPGDTRDAPQFNVNRGIDPFNGDFRRDADQAVIDRARTAAEKHTDYRGVTSEDRDAILATLERYDGETARDIAEHVLVTGSPEYVRGFEQYARNPGIVPQVLVEAPMQSRSAMSTTAANGGYLIPHFLDPTIRLTNAGTNNNVRALANSVQITTQKWEGVTSAGVTAAWLGEATEVSDGSPTFQGPSITPQKEAAWLYGSYEMLADTGFGPIGELIADAFDRLEETAFTTGTGSSQPYGLITQLSGTGPSLAGSSGAAGAADFVVADIYALKNGLTPRFRRNASWMANPATFDVIRGFGNGASGTNLSSFWVDLGADHPSMLIGKSAYENEAMDSTRVSGSNDDILLFGDFKQYMIVDRVGTTVMYNPMVLGGSSNFPTGQAGWFAFKRTGADVITSNGFRLLRV